ncbi:hypothetical protein V8E53_000252, partial [Lactarius tabidus]
MNANSTVQYEALPLRSALMLFPRIGEPRSMSVLAAGPVDCQADRDLWHEYQSGSGAATGVGE